MIKLGLSNSTFVSRIIQIISIICLLVSTFYLSLVKACANIIQKSYLNWQNPKIVKPDAMTGVRTPVPPLVCVSL